MNCRNADELLSESLDEALGAEVQVALEDHLASCPACVARLRGYVSVLEALRGVAAVEAAEVAPPVPEILVRRILDARDRSTPAADDSRRIG